MKTFILIEIKDGEKTGNKKNLTEDEFLKLNLKNIFKIYKSGEKIEVAIDHDKFKGIK